MNICEKGYCVHKHLTRSNQKPHICYCLDCNHNRAMCLLPPTETVLKQMETIAFKIKGKRLFLRTKQYWKTGNPAIANKLIVKIVTTIREFDESIKRGPRLSASETATILENIAWSIREEAEK